MGCAVSWMTRKKRVHNDHTQPAHQAPSLQRREKSDKTPSFSKFKFLQLDTIDQMPDGANIWKSLGRSMSMKQRNSSTGGFVDRLVELWPDFYEACFETGGQAITEGLVSRLDVLNRKDYIWNSIPCMAVTDMLLRSMDVEGLIFAGTPVTRETIPPQCLDVYKTLNYTKQKMAEESLSQLEIATLRRIILSGAPDKMLHGNEDEMTLWIDALSGVVAGMPPTGLPAMPTEGDTPVSQAGSATPQAEDDFIPLPPNLDEVEEKGYASAKRVSSTQERRVVLMELVRESLDLLKPALSSLMFRQCIATVLQRLDEFSKPPDLLDENWEVEHGSSQQKPRCYPPPEYEKEIICGSRFKWIKGGLVGYGAHGKVFKVWEVNLSREIAIKEIDIQGSHDTNSSSNKSDYAGKTEREISIMSCLRHPYIISFLGTERTEETMYIMMDYASAGSLARYSKAQKGLPEAEACGYVAQMLLGLDYLHSNGILHRDIKGANCLLFPAPQDVELQNNGEAPFDTHDPRNRAVLKLADFGASKVFDTSSKTQSNGLTKKASIVGTAHWMAPEMIRGQSVGKSADIWSVGATVIEVLSGMLPWSGITEQVTIFFKVTQTSEMPSLPEHLSDPARHFLSLCLHRKATERASTKALLMHRWLRPFTLEARAKILEQISSEVSSLAPGRDPRLPDLDSPLAPL